MAESGKPKVFIARPIPEEALNIVKEHCDYRIWNHPDGIPRDELLKEVADVNGLLTVGGYINEELFRHAPKLKVVSTISVGYNNFDIEAMIKHNVIGTHTPYVLDDTVADLMLTLMLACARRVTELDQYVKNGQWKKGDNEKLFGLDMHHKKLGIIGMGRIGEKIAKRAKFGFDMQISYFNRSRNEEAEKRLGAVYLPMEVLLRDSDFVVLMTPYTSETHHLIGKEQFQLMKKSAVFVNGSRGKNVDEQALVEALSNGDIFAAGLDVFEKEPIDPNHPLLRLPNVITLPHIGSATEKTRLDMAITAARNLVQGVTGQIPDHVIPELKNNMNIHN